MGSNGTFRSTSVACRHACLQKLIAHVSVDSMQSSGWGGSFLTMALSSFFFFFLHLPSSLPLLSFLLDAEVLAAAAATATVGSFIWRVGGRLIWKDPNKTCETMGMKLMVLSSTSLPDRQQSTKRGSGRNSGNDDDGNGNGDGNSNDDNGQGQQGRRQGRQQWQG
jgi:hypothetical protein